MASAPKIAILHSDPSIATAIARFLAKTDLEVIHPQSLTQLERELCNTSIAAAVMDLPEAGGGGFEVLERVANSPARPVVIVITALDMKSIDAVRRQASAQGLKLRVFRKTLDDALLKACLTSLEKRGTDFTIADLKEAMARDYLRVEYQPKVPLTAASVQACAVEALCRIHHPRFGNVYPEHFIRVAEKEGMICTLTDAVVCQTFKDWSRWRNSGLIARLSLNVSPELLRNEEWCDLLLKRCEEFGVGPEQITLEITETSSSASHEAALDVLTRLRSKGFTLSIDDFGTGPAGLATLYKLPFGELKIDKSFTCDLRENPEARALIESTIDMAQRLGLKVVAEGVETEEVFRELRQMGCQDAQGYFISKPLSADKVPAFFSEWSLMPKAGIVPAAVASPLSKIAKIHAMLAEKLNCQDGDEQAPPERDRGAR